jgi:hypothetical protein
VNAPPTISMNASPACVDFALRIMYTHTHTQNVTLRYIKTSRAHLLGFRLEDRGACVRAKN